jgi:hypothetical protein
MMSHSPIRNSECPAPAAEASVRCAAAIATMRLTSVALGKTDSVNHALQPQLLAEQFLQSFNAGAHDDFRARAYQANRIRMTFLPFQRERE